MAETLTNGTVIPQGSDVIDSSGVAAMRAMGSSIDRGLGTLGSEIGSKRPIEHTPLGTENLDSVIVPGNYYQRTSANATPARNYPVQASGPVVVTAAADRTQVQQEFTRFSSNAAERYWRTFAGTWSPWWRVVESTDPRLSDSRTPKAHTHAISNVSGLQPALDGKASTLHTHSIQQVNGLDSALTGLDDRLDGIATAYDVYVEEQGEGPVLPRAEWLDSLIGEPGPEGPYGGTEVTDPQVASLVTDGGSATHAVLDGLYGAQQNIVVGVPTDYPTLQVAVDSMQGRHTPPGVTVELRIESGHQPASGLAVTNGDWSRFLITSADAEVSVADNFDGDFIRATQARAPRLGAVIDMRDLGGDGYAMWRSSVGHVNEWCGVKNAAGRGLYVTDNSSCFALRSVFTGSGDRNVWITRASTLDAELSDFSANKGGDNAIYVSRASRANIESCKITDAFQNALTCTRSWVAANHCDMSRAGLRGIVTDSEVFARDCTIANVATEGVSADQAAVVTIRDSVITGSGTFGVLSAGSSVVELNGTSVTVSGTKDLGVIRAGVINGHGVSTSNSSGSTPSVADTNVSALNSATSQGVVWA